MAEFPEAVAQILFRSDEPRQTIGQRQLAVEIDSQGASREVGGRDACLDERTGTAPAAASSASRTTV